MATISESSASVGPPSTIAVIPLRAGPVSTSVASPPGDVSPLLLALKILLGVRKVKWGFQAEALHKLVVVIDWEACPSPPMPEELSHYTSRVQAVLQAVPVQLTASPGVLVFTTRLACTVDPPGTADLDHVPVTEMAVFYFSPTPVPDEAARQEIVTRSAQRTGQLYRDHPKIRAYAAGWQGVDEAPKEVGYDLVESGKAVIFIKFLGWPSIADHLEVRQTPAFKSQAPDLKMGAVGGEMKHVIFRIC